MMKSGLCIPQIPSATNVLEISDMQEGNLEPGLRRRPGSNNVTFDRKPLDGVFGMHNAQIRPQRTVFLLKPTEICQPFGVPSFLVLSIFLVFRHFTLPGASRYELRESTGCFKLPRLA
jgi:hypothetical protein